MRKEGRKGGSGAGKGEKKWWKWRQRQVKEKADERVGKEGRYNSRRKEAK